LTDYMDFTRDLVIDIVATFILVFLIYYPRHRDRDMAVMLGMFNVFLFTIVITLTITEINLAAGFALFAVLSIISLRSVNIAKVEVGYLFGVIALALINGVSFTDYILLALCNIIILAAAALLDSPLFIRPSLQIETTLEGIPPSEFSDTAKLTKLVESKLSTPVERVRILKYNADKDSLRLMVDLKAS